MPPPRLASVKRGKVAKWRTGRGGCKVSKEEEERKVRGQDEEDVR